jgi:hypothetical protein
MNMRRVGWFSDPRWVARAVIPFLVMATRIVVPATASRSLPPAVHDDFNGDGIGDLAIGVPGEDVGSQIDAGAVSVIYGSLGGLTEAVNQVWTQDAAMGESESEDRFGAALATGDFNGDGFSDLAVGAPGEDVTVGFPVPEAIADAGAVTVIFGSDKVGLRPDGRQVLIQGASGSVLLPDTPEPGDAFGSALASGDFGRTPTKAPFLSADDLAIGVPGEDFEHDFFRVDVDTGAVAVLYGSPLAEGLTASGRQLLHQCIGQGFCALADRTEDGDRFGSSLAAANLGASSHVDLAVGVPFEDVGSVPDAGAVNVFYGSRAVGLSETDGQFLTQDALVDEAEDASELSDRFGWSLAGGDFDGDETAELVVGTPFEDLGGLAGLDAGSVEVIGGSERGLSLMEDRFWTQDDIGTASEGVDHFGWSLAAGNLGRTTHDDVAVGVPGEDLPPLLTPILNAGGVNVLYGTDAGLSEIGGEFWTQDTVAVDGAEVLDEGEAQDEFGIALAIAEFGMGSESDLVVGVHREEVSGVRAGAVNVLSGSATGLSVAGNRFWHQDSPGILETAEEGDDFGGALSHG